nr:hypothetical protein CFP56_74420 [Quercus suber]
MSNGPGLSGPTAVSFHGPGSLSNSARQLLLLRSEQRRTRLLSPRFRGVWGLPSLAMLVSLLRVADFGRDRMSNASLLAAITSASEPPRCCQSPAWCLWLHSRCVRPVPSMTATSAFTSLALFSCTWHRTWEIYRSSADEYLLTSHPISLQTYHRISQLPHLRPHVVLRTILLPDPPRAHAHNLRHPLCRRRDPKRSRHRMDLESQVATQISVGRRRSNQGFVDPADRRHPPLHPVGEHIPPSLRARTCADSPRARPVVRVVREHGTDLRAVRLSHRTALQRAGRHHRRAERESPRAL